jgi:hypothetical protein
VQTIVCMDNCVQTIVCMDNCVQTIVCMDNCVQTIVCMDNCVQDDYENKRSCTSGLVLSTPINTTIIFSSVKCES